MNQFNNKSITRRRQNKDEHEEKNFLQFHFFLFSLDGASSTSGALLRKFNLGQFKDVGKKASFGICSGIIEGFLFRAREKYVFVTQTIRPPVEDFLHKAFFTFFALFSQVNQIPGILPIPYFNNAFSNLLLFIYEKIEWLMGREKCAEHVKNVTSS